MPELPEVETIRRGLDRLLRGRRISSVRIDDPRVLQGFGPSGKRRRDVSESAFRRDVAGAVVEGVARRGKYLMFRLSNGKILVGHLRMTGRMIVGPPRPEARARFSFEGTDDVLSFCDTRRFGELWIVDDPARDPSLSLLGPEPLEEGWDEDAWARALRASRAKIHAALMDQRLLAGVGNIYALEALFHSGIRPARRCHTLKKADLPPLLANIRRVLKEGLARRGVTFNDYRDAEGRRGLFQKHLYVYGRSGSPCKECGTPLVGGKVNGRGAVYCPRCQK